MRSWFTHYRARRLEWSLSIFSALFGLVLVLPHTSMATTGYSPVLSVLGEGVWGAVYATILRARPVAYFSAEFGLHESLPIYSGGLGVLAGERGRRRCRVVAQFGQAERRHHGQQRETVTAAGLVWPVRLRNCTNTVFNPAPADSRWLALRGRGL